MTDYGFLTDFGNGQYWRQEYRRCRIVKGFACQTPLTPDLLNGQFELGSLRLEPGPFVRQM
jgi:hypothetical protein